MAPGDMSPRPSLAPEPEDSRRASPSASTCRPDLPTESPAPPPRGRQHSTVGDFISTKRTRSALPVSRAQEQGPSKSHGTCCPWHEELGAGPQGPVRVKGRHGDSVPCGVQGGRVVVSKLGCPRPPGWKVNAQGAVLEAGAMSPQGRAEGHRLPPPTCPQAPGGSSLRTGPGDREGGR